MNALRLCFRLLVPVFLAATLTGSALAKQGKEVIIYLKDGQTVQGEVVQITKDFIKVDPEGPIMVRTVPGDKIEAVEFVGSGERLSFPLDKSQVPGGLDEDPQVRRSKRSDGLRPVGLTFSVGRSSMNGSYYEGIESGLCLGIGGYYRFSQDNKYGNSFFVGFSYRYSAPGLSIKSVYIDYDLSVVFDKVRVHQYNFEFGATTKVSRSDSYAYLLMGLSVVDTKITAHAISGGTSLPAEVVGESKGALRLAGGGVIGMTSRIGVNMQIGYDIVIIKSENSGNDYYSYNYGYYDDTDAIGGILSLEIGLVWEP